MISRKLMPPADAASDSVHVESDMEQNNGNAGSSLEPGRTSAATPDDPDDPARPRSSLSRAGRRHVAGLASSLDPSSREGALVPAKMPPSDIRRRPAKRPWSRGNISIETLEIRSASPWLWSRWSMGKRKRASQAACQAPARPLPRPPRAMMALSDRTGTARFRPTLPTRDAGTSMGKVANLDGLSLRLRSPAGPNLSSSACRCR